MHHPKLARRLGPGLREVCGLIGDEPGLRTTVITRLRGRGRHAAGRAGPRAAADAFHRDLDEPPRDRDEIQPDRAGEIHLEFRDLAPGARLRRPLGLSTKRAGGPLRAFRRQPLRSYTVVVPTVVAV